MDIKKHNDRTGIFFLITLISLVFFIDIYIELDKVIKSGKSTRTFSFMNTYPFSSSTNLISSKNFFEPRPQTLFIDNENSLVNISRLELSMIFFLLGSFAFFYKFFNFDPVKQIISFLYFISFIRKESSNTALPRPPPYQNV